MVYDCIPFFNEIDILNLRLHILDPYVDRFVIEEATTTFSGQPKTLCFEQNKALFKPFLSKITYVVVHDDIKDELSLPGNKQQPDKISEGTAFSKDKASFDRKTPIEGMTSSEGKNFQKGENSLKKTEQNLWQKAPTHARDVWQKNHLTAGLVHVNGYLRIDCKAGHTTSSRADYAVAPAAEPNDIVIFGDCDEIPNPEVLKGICAEIQREARANEKVYHLRQRNFYAFLNMEEVSGSLLSVTGDFPEVRKEDRKWLGTKVTTVAGIPAEGIDRLRDLVSLSDSRSVRVDNGGWHFGYMGGHHETNAARRIGVKVKAAAHQEYNDKEILAETMDHLYLGQDIFGRDAHFERVAIDNTYPEYLRQHQEEYAHLILPPVTPWIRLRSQLDLSIGRFCRKALRHLRKH